MRHQIFGGAPSSSTPAKAIADLIEGVTEKWAKQRKAEERDRSARLRRDDRLIYRVRPTSLKDATYSGMREAYMAASANGTLPANPRQIMYAARPDILRITGKQTLDSQYFCQTLLPDYIREHRDTCAGWDIAWDDRGHFVEPHTGKSFGLGTLNVRKYVASYASPAYQEAGFAPATIGTHWRASPWHMRSDGCAPNSEFRRGLALGRIADYRPMAELREVLARNPSSLGSPAPGFLFGIGNDLRLRRWRGEFLLLW